MYSKKSVVIIFFKEDGRYEAQKSKISIYISLFSIFYEVTLETCWSTSCFFRRFSKYLFLAASLSSSLRRCRICSLSDDDLENRPPRLEGSSPL